MKRPSAMEAREDDSDELDLEQVIHLRPRRISAEQLRRYEGYIAEIFGACGLDLHTDATERFIRALFDITDGYEGDPKVLTIFSTECRGEPDCQLRQVSEAHHLRGVRESAPLTRNSEWRRAFASNPALRSEFLTASGIRS